jgi:hypothetical protein
MVVQSIRLSLSLEFMISSLSNLSHLLDNLLTVLLSTSFLILFSLITSHDLMAVNMFRDKNKIDLANIIETCLK